jgi:hypothetical protein
LILEEFGFLRSKNIEELKSYHITKESLQMKATHPHMGKITLKQL